VLNVYGIYLVYRLSRNSYHIHTFAWHHNYETEYICRLFENEQACITLFSFLPCCNVSLFGWKQRQKYITIFIYECYDKSIQQPASAVSALSFDSPLQSEGPVHTLCSPHKRASTFLLTLDLTLTHLKDVVLDLSQYTPFSCIIRVVTHTQRAATLISSQHRQQYKEIADWAHLWPSDNGSSSTASSLSQFLCF